MVRPVMIETIHCWYFHILRIRKWTNSVTFVWNYLSDSNSCRNMCWIGNAPFVCLHSFCSEKVWFLQIFRKLRSQCAQKRVMGVKCVRRWKYVTSCLKWTKFWNFPTVSQPSSTLYFIVIRSAVFELLNEYRRTKNIFHLRTYVAAEETFSLSNHYSKLDHVAVVVTCILDVPGSRKSAGMPSLLPGVSYFPLNCSRKIQKLVTQTKSQLFLCHYITHYRSYNST
jgi:hypothetical protein